ncbi:putative fad-linked sulfhydryl oxidase alr protein [Botrytis fragariae]|uniref:Sulfhydryl oxidase n=1 Tax=Botrytis fragariae TaxID=1964551 RepID=A0A8H6EL95_9HELO|nr:putative fad-linked sulfhydryl oxidase alr protein [Botrytis fragariae]KAF5876378.1 putative fad-linked sulfhydryl oxidase alr protein [Botrytis fragariae]
MSDDTQDETTNTPTASGAVPPKKYPKAAAPATPSPPSPPPPNLSNPPPPPPPNRLPPDVEALGRASWTFLHTLSASYPSTPTPTDRTNISTFMSLFSQLYPCWTCASDFQTYMAENKVRTESRAEFGKWMCEAHNDVNRKLGKREFDCERWEERWRTGWRDGRCG